MTLEEMPKWEVTVQYPSNVSSIEIGLQRVGSSLSFERVASVDIDHLKESDIHGAIDRAVSKAITQRDELNRKIDLVNLEMKCFGNEIP